MSNNSKLKYIDLFCGIGGFHQALKKLDFECIFACDIDKNCRDVYKNNYIKDNNIKLMDDITKLDIKKDIDSFDILCAGFPCQAFSKAGNQRGFDDDRGNLFFNICKIVEYHKPKYLLLENVRNLISHDKENTWKVIKKNIDKLGYFTYDKPPILNPLYFGIPQSRERVIIMCKRKDLGELRELPLINKALIKETSLKTIVEKTKKEDVKKYKLKGKMEITRQVWDAFLKILKENSIKVPKYPIWTDWWDGEGENTSVTKKDKKKTNEENKAFIKKKQKDFYKKYKNWIDNNKEFYKKNIKLLKPWLENSRKKKEWIGAVRKMEWQTKSDHLEMKDVLWSPRGSGIRIKNINYSPTLVAMASMIPIYGPQSRQLTPRECARLQSFPEDFKIDPEDNKAYKQFGNSVNCDNVKTVIKATFDHYGIEYF